MSGCRSTSSTSSTGLRGLSRRLSEDAASHQELLDRRLRYRHELQAELTAELRTPAVDLAPGTVDEELPRTLGDFRFGEGLAARTWRQHLLRVSQLALTRILLYRSWEDAGFVEERLFDGGFGQLYERVGRNLGEVLEAAFEAGRTRRPASATCPRLRDGVGRIPRRGSAADRRRGKPGRC